MADVFIHPQAARYRLVLHPADGEGDHLVTAPAFPGLSAFGETPEQAIEEARIALSGFLAMYEDDGRAFPPFDDPYAPENFSGKFLVRMPKSLHARLARLADDEDVSINQLAVTFLSASAALQPVVATESQLDKSTTR